MTETPKIAMTSVYMDKGEGAEYLLGQIQRMAAQEVNAYYLDIICFPVQVKQAINILEFFYTTLSLYLPDISLKQVFTSITCNDKIRPSTIAVVTMTSGSEVAIKDVNPERPGR